MFYYKIQVSHPVVALKIEMMKMPQIPGNISDKLLRKWGTSCKRTNKCLLIKRKYTLDYIKKLFVISKLEVSQSLGEFLKSAFMAISETIRNIKKYWKESQFW